MVAGNKGVYSLDIEIPIQLFPKSQVIRFGCQLKFKSAYQKAIL
jgi:hypothetical protein